MRRPPHALTLFARLFIRYELYEGDLQTVLQQFQQLSRNSDSPQAQMHLKSLFRALMALMGNMVSQSHRGLPV
jgi:hypothetical protein